MSGIALIIAGAAWEVVAGGIGIKYFHTDGATLTIFQITLIGITCIALVGAKYALLGLVLTGLIVIQKNCFKRGALDDQPQFLIGD